MADHAFDDLEDDVDIEEAPERPPRRQRLLIITLSVGCVALAVSNIALATRLTQIRRAVADRPAVRVPADTPTASEPAAVEPAAAASIPSQTAPRVSREPGMPRPTAPRVANAPEAGEAAVDPAPASTVPPAAVPEREMTAVARTPDRTAPERAPAELPPRPVPSAEPRVAAAQRTSERATPLPSTPERATASWMVQEYGRPDAEARARTVADFYGAHSPEGAYWRRVLGEIAGGRR
jgi:hypothetical protein